MARQIIINATPEETRIATTEDGRVLHCQVERSRERGLAGSIYKGHVTRVLPGMQAAFVDIGLPKAAFLPSADYLTEEEASSNDRRVSPPIETTADGGFAGRQQNPPPPIEQRLREGQEVIVQIGKEPIGSKGARVTSHVSLPGRLLVYLPVSPQLGISRRISDEDERLRLQNAVESVSAIRGGVIVRTAGEGAEEDEIQADLELLHELWLRIRRAAATAKAPALLHRDLDLTLRTVRDMRVMDIGQVVVDDRATHGRILEFVEAAMPQSRPRVELYEGGTPIFERHGVETQIAKALEPRVWLRSGGYIVVDTTEALTSIDVNTGRFTGKTDQRDTALKTNLEAARAIGEQLRLREIGGVIVIDFIDLEFEEDRDAVLAALSESLAEQRTRTEVHGFSELGLVEMTRHRKRENLSQRLCEPCPQCRGTGYVKATATTAYEILRALRREAGESQSPRRVEVSLHPSVAAFLTEFEPDAVPNIQRDTALAVTLVETPTCRPEEYSLAASGSTTGAAVDPATELAQPPKCD